MTAIEVLEKYSAIRRCSPQADMSAVSSRKHVCDLNLVIPMISGEQHGTTASMYFRENQEFPSDNVYSVCSDLRKESQIHKRTIAQPQIFDWKHWEPSNGFLIDYRLDMCMKILLWRNGFQVDKFELIRKMIGLKLCAGQLARRNQSFSRLPFVWPISLLVFVR